MKTFHERKTERAERYFKYVHGWILTTCGACNGTGYYDNTGSPKCGNCEGTGKTRTRGPKAIKENTNGL